MNLLYSIFMLIILSSIHMNDDLMIDVGFIDILTYIHSSILLNVIFMLPEIDILIIDCRP